MLQFLFTYFTGEFVLIKVNRCQEADRDFVKVSTNAAIRFRIQKTSPLSTVKKKLLYFLSENFEICHIGLIKLENQSLILKQSDFCQVSWFLIEFALEI